MCGRYTLKTPKNQIERRFGVDDVPDLPLRYNIGPAQDALVIRPGADPGRRTAAMLRWGLIPSWTKARGSAPLLINARAETVAARPAFRDPFRHRRCLVVADGFYEWAQHGPGKPPFHFTADHGALFGMAGLWDRWRPPGADEDVETFCIITTAANDLLAPYHDRMPVILDEQNHEDWLNPALVDAGALELLLRPYPAIRMLARAVSSRVNSVKHDDAACLESADAATGSGPGQTHDASGKGEGKSAQLELEGF